MAEQQLTEAFIYPGPSQLFQISCNPIRPCVGYSPAINPEAPANLRNKHVWKGPYKTSQAPYTFQLGQQLLKLCGQPWIDCEVVKLTCDPAKNALAPYGVRKSMKEGWFLLQESLHLKGGFPPNQNLPTITYEGKPLIKRSNGLFQGEEWANQDTRIVDHEELLNVYKFADYSQTKDFNLLQATLMRYVFGWRDMAPRNYVFVNGAVYLVDIESFSPETMNPLGQFLRWEEIKTFMWNNVSEFRRELVPWLHRVKDALASQEAVDLCFAAGDTIWPMTTYGYSGFLEDVKYRLLYIIEGVEAINKPGLGLISPTEHPFLRSLTMKGPKNGEVNVTKVHYQEFCSKLALKELKEEGGEKKVLTKDDIEAPPSSLKKRKDQPKAISKAEELVPKAKRAKV